MPSILRYIGRAAAPTHVLYGTDALAACQASRGLLAPAVLAPGQPATQPACAGLALLSRSLPLRPSAGAAAEASEAVMSCPQPGHGPAARPPGPFIPAEPALVC